MSLVLSHGWNNIILIIDIKLNEHWYSDNASREFLVQRDESDNCIAVNEDAVLNQSLKNDNISKETPKMTIKNYAQHK